MTVSPNTFSCADAGPQTVTLTVTDINNNSSTCNAQVTVRDETPPVARCRNRTVGLNAAGSATITAAQVNNGSSDNCNLLGRLTGRQAALHPSILRGYQNFSKHLFSRYLHNIISRLNVESTSLNGESTRPNAPSTPLNGEWEGFSAFCLYLYRGSCLFTF